MPCSSCCSANSQRGVSDELEKVLAERKVLQGQRHELRARINAAPQKLDLLRQQVRKSLRTHAEIVRLQKVCKAKNARERNATASAAAALASSPLFEEARLLERMGLEPDVPCLLVEVWTDSVLLGEQWLNWEVLSADTQRIEVALEPRILLSREDEKKTSMQSTCGGSRLGSIGNLQLHFSHTDDAKDTVLFNLHLSSKQPWKQSAIPTRVVLKIWSWGGSAKSLKMQAEERAEGSTQRIKGQKSQKGQRSQKASLSCWLQAINAEVLHPEGKVSDKISSDSSDNWLQVGSSGDEVLVIGRHHSLIQRLLEEKKEFLSCISREHLRLWFDSKSEILSVENLSSNPIAIQNGEDLSTVPAGKVARAQNGDILRFIAPESLRKAVKADSFLLFRIVVQKPVASCGSRMCKGGGGDLLYTVNTKDEPLENQFYCGSCCAQLHLADPTCTFSQTAEILPPSWNLLCESQAVDVDIVTDIHPNVTVHSGETPGLWAADFGAQKLHLPSAFAQRAALNEEQVARRKGQLEHAKRAEIERFQQEAERKKQMLPEAEDKLTEDVRYDQFTCEPTKQYAVVDTGSAAASTSFVQPRVIQSEKQIKKEAEDAEVPHELQTSAKDGEDEPNLPHEASKEKAADKVDQRKRRILHDAEPLLPLDSKENHQRLLQLLWQKSGLLYRQEHMEIHASVQQASLAISLNAKVALQFAAVEGRKLSRLEATLHMDFGALHCESGQSPLADGVPAELLNGQVSSFKELMDFELMDVLGQPPLLEMKANLLDTSSEEVNVMSVQLRLPLLTTSFLKPLQPTFRFAQEWDAPDLQAAANVHSTADWMRPEHAAALTLGGSLQLFHLATGIIGLAAELPAHGCHESEAVLVRIAAFADGRMTLQTRSQELRLAEAVAAAMASILLSPPQS